MTQQEVLDFLNKHKKKKFTTTEMATMLNKNRGNVINACKKLREHNFIKFEMGKDKEKGNIIFIYWVG
jgi:predicted transcriptional regulator